MASSPQQRASNRYLLPSEHQVVSVRRHWVVLLLPLAAGLLALFAAGWISGSLSGTSGPIDNVVWLLALAVVVWFGWRLLEWWENRFIVTDKRILLLSGFLTHRIGMMPLRKVTDMTYERPLIGRLFGFGTFVMESAGQDQALHRVDYLPHPDMLYREVSTLLFGRKTERAAALLTEDDDH